MPPSDQYYTLKQFRIDLQRMVDFCSTTLSRTLSNEERTYYSARKFALIEIQRMTKYMRDPDEIPGEERI